MIKDKLTKKIDEILSRRDLTEMAFTKGLEPPQDQNFDTQYSPKTKQRTKYERKQTSLI